jgi:protein-disulfide isomerase
MRVTSTGAIAVAFSLGAGPVGLAAPASDAPVATVGGRTIKRAEVEERARPKLVEIENERYEALRESLDEIIAEELLKQEAKARGTTPEALEKQEVDGKVAAPTDAEVQKVYDDNKEQLGNQTLEQIKPRIVAYVRQQKEEERRQAFLAELKAKHKTTVSLRPPVVEVAAAGRPARGGGPNAPVTIIEFSDYQCPFCKRAEESVEKVMKEYGDKVRLVFRDFPLPMHPQARPASEAAACANDQGKFWEYHAKLFANQSALADANLKAYAKDLGLDAAKFDKCVADKKHAKKVEEDIAEGSKVGVTGTPAFFINGRMLSGAQPFEKFKEVIDDELANAKPGKSS